MKKYISIVIIVIAFITPNFSKASEITDLQATLIQVLTETITQLTQQIKELLAQQSVKIDNLSTQINTTHVGSNVVQLSPINDYKITFTPSCIDKENSKVGINITGNFDTGLITITSPTTAPDGGRFISFVVRSSDTQDQLDSYIKSVIAGDYDYTVELKQNNSVVYNNSGILNVPVCNQ